MCLASFVATWFAVAQAANCHWFACIAVLEAFHCIVSGLVEKGGRFCAAPYMVWVYCKLPDLPIPVDFWDLRETVSATERTEGTCHDTILRELWWGGSYFLALVLGPSSEAYVVRAVADRLSYLF